MRKASIAEMSAFVAIAERESFARAATQLGVSRSSLSESLRALEERLGVRLLNRTTRSVALTEAGERLLVQLRPLLDNFDAALESVNAFRDSPAGHIRITVPRPAARTIIAPILSRFLSGYPAVTLEVAIDSNLTDIVRDRFDAGIRPGHRVEQDMIALRVGEDAEPTVVASPDYLRRHGTPTEPADLRSHNCTRMRFSSNAFARWAFEKRGRSLEVDVTGSLITGDSDLAVRAALDGVALARVPRHAVQTHLADGTLVAVLEDWRPRSVGFYLYYPSRRQMPAALQALIDMLKSQLSAHRANGPSRPGAFANTPTAVRARREPMKSRSAGRA
jgi:DNA-binding transcriptional LysR family regulator